MQDVVLDKAELEAARVLLSKFMTCHNCACLPLSEIMHREAQGLSEHRDGVCADPDLRRAALATGKPSVCSHYTPKEAFPVLALARKILAALNDSMRREQKLVDLCFDIGLLISDTGNDREGNPITLYKKSQQERAAWIAEQLRLCGFPTHPCGASHGVLEPNHLRRS